LTRRARRYPPRLQWFAGAAQCRSRQNWRHAGFTAARWKEAAMREQSAAARAVNIQRRDR
jgi:hypothetical protein